MKKLNKRNTIIIGAVSLVLVVAILLAILLPNCSKAPDKDPEEKPVINVDATDKSDRKSVV